MSTTTTVVDTTRIDCARYEVVLVAYHSCDELAGLLDAIHPDQRFVVVDNASGADGVPEVVRKFPHGRWMDGGNSGFAHAANLGVQSSTAEFIVFANPDSRPTPEIWDALINDLQADPHLGSVAAATIDRSGHIQIGVGGWEPTPLRAVVHALGLHRILPSAGLYARPQRNQHLDLDWMTGACMAVRREVFLELGGFDDRYFVYNEDMAFGRALRLDGRQQRLRTDLLVPHAIGGSGGGITEMPQQRGASMAAYLRDHNGLIATQVMRTALALGMVPRAAVARARGDRTLANQHLAYIRGIITARSPYKP